ncbi:MAG TPA: histidine kinase [Thermoanaerobaculia bacterium]|nr:histidine kinase [Thermoanaerobaculia bacterium]
MPKRTEEGRRAPEDFLVAATRDSSRGKLKVYLGMAAGVGKTVRMLDDAHALRRQGIDVVIGYVETHGRAETAARIGDLEVIPRKKIEYKGTTIEEMDLDACIARHPDVLVVDELPHTNVPGSKHEKRWQDVEEILKAGISVMTALNVQHLEGVQDVVRSATGIEIRERIPDRIVRIADSVIIVDLPVPELQERLKQGKIYPPEQAARALQNFFRTEMLVRLRELALLQTAEFSGRELPLEITSAAAEIRIAVAVPYDPVIAKALILRASRMAGRMNTKWYALYVRRRRDHPEHMSATQHRLMIENVQMAMSLGASVVTRESEDVVATILDFVQKEHIGLLVLGRPTRRGLLGRVSPGIVSQVIERARGVDVFVVDVEEETA